VAARGEPLLDVRGLTVAFDTPEGAVRAVNGLDLELRRGECLGIVGESGSGKSQSFLAMLGLLAANGTVGGSVRFNGEELIGLSRSRLNQLRGDRISVIFQDSITGLTPHMKIGRQMGEVLVAHRGISRREAEATVLEIMEVVQIPEPKRRFEQYPHELSGGMRQRIMIAQALLCQPELLIADEPTTALDVTVQAAILRLFVKLKQHTQTAIVVITHDLGVVAGLCDRVGVMYGGSLVEIADVDTLFASPSHPYTQGLIRSMPRLDADVLDELPAIPGQPPNLQQLPRGCVFAPRCEHAIAHCAEEKPALRQRTVSQWSACHRETRS
jgi:oligopeptide transport system ATP-binding protein